MSRIFGIMLGTMRHKYINFQPNNEFRFRCFSTAHHIQDDTLREVEHHSQLANDWWNCDGPMQALHALNTIRVPFIRDGIIARGNVKADLVNKSTVLHGQHIMECGCGGGLLSEQLGRLGATVTGIDLGEELISVAREHLNTHSATLLDRVSYRVEPIEVHAKQYSNRYDAVVVSEVLEHVNDKAAFLTACVQTLKPGGSLFVTTLNKTIPLWIAGIAVAEYMLQTVPKNTHHWDKLITPLDLQRILDTLNCNTVLLNGSTYDVWSNRWRWINSTSMCYALQAVKQESI